MLRRGERISVSSETPGVLYLTSEPVKEKPGSHLDHQASNQQRPSPQCVSTANKEKRACIYPGETISTPSRSHDTCMSIHAQMRSPATRREKSSEGGERRGPIPRYLFSQNL
jgi:hypothetical protein